MAAVPTDSDLITAINHGNSVEVKDMLSNGANPNAEYNGTPALILAAVYNNESMMADLLNKGANVNARNAGGTALSYAISVQNPSMVKLLVSHGADIKSPGPMGMTPEKIAQVLKNSSVLNALYSSKTTQQQIDTSNINTSLSMLSDNDIAELKKTASDLDKISDFKRRVAYFLGTKNYSMNQGWAPQRVQLITPYSLMKNAYYVTNKNFENPSKDTINSIMSHRNTAWIWVWSVGAYDYLSYIPSPAITNVVIKDKNGTIHHHIDTIANTPHEVMSASGITQGSLWAFPIDVFNTDNAPFEIILVDTEMHQKPLKISIDKLKECK
jgi:hypothetical protein